MEKRNEVLELSFEFALQVIEFSELLEEKRKFVIARQLLKSGTGIGASVREAQSCESRADFIHKLKISHKEVQETEYWLLLCAKAAAYPDPPETMAGLLLSIQKLLNKIVTTSRANNRR
ncbi:four helix bundle protein [Cyclobacterium xiamenense]|uniref:Four helix bundle protein n=1 Tax=Cyclobacterium xiamenense TaxID=1297121 RepID=A0A1H6WD59_9BACT|nr:four helix bundle protein [Cyclobacterium xiamenense]SEJ14959.1 four helix bundle protein [Cyclobacterium xiamenense]